MSPVTGEFPHKGPETRKMFQYDDVIMLTPLHMGKHLTSYLKFAVAYHYLLKKVNEVRYHFGGNCMKNQNNFGNDKLLIFNKETVQVIYVLVHLDYIVFVLKQSGNRDCFYIIRHLCHSQLWSIVKIKKRDTRQHDSCALFNILLIIPLKTKSLPNISTLWLKVDRVRVPQ